MLEHRAKGIQCEPPVVSHIQVEGRKPVVITRHARPVAENDLLQWPTSATVEPIGSPINDKERVGGLLDILEANKGLEWNVHQQAAATELAQWVEGAQLPTSLVVRIYDLLRCIFSNPSLAQHTCAISAPVGLLKACRAGLENFNEVQQARILQWSMEQQLQGPVRGPPEKASPKKAVEAPKVT